MACKFTKISLADDIKISEVYLYVLGRIFSCLIFLTWPSSIVPFVCCSIVTCISLILAKNIKDRPLLHNGFFPKRIYIVQCIERMTWISAIIYGTNSWMCLIGNAMLVSINLMYMGWFISILLARINPRLGQQAFTLYGIHDQGLAAIQVRAKHDMRIILLALQPWKGDTISNDKSEDVELENIANEETTNAIPSISNEEIEDSDEEDNETGSEAVTETEAERFRQWQRVFYAETETETEDSYDYLHQHGPEIKLEDLLNRDYELMVLQRSSSPMCCQESGSDYLEPQETETDHYLPQQVTETDHFVEQPGSLYAYDFDLMGRHNYVSVNQSLCLENQLLRTEIDDIRALNETEINDILALNEEHETYWRTELTLISNSHEADRKNWEEEKQKIMKKLASSKSLVISEGELAREREVRLLELQETINDLSTKLSTATGLSEVTDKLVQEMGEKCSELEENNDDLLTKLSVMSTTSEFNNMLLRVREKECKKLEKEKSKLVAIVEKISGEKMKNFRKFEQEKNELKAKLSAALASSALYCELLHDYGPGR